MTIVFPFHAGDAQLLSQLLRWIARLGFNADHSALLVADGAVDYHVAEALMKEARHAFGRVNMRAIQPTQGWIPGSNALFECAAKTLAGQPFLFVEPDATPLKPGWIEEIEVEYARCGKLFMGALVTHQTPKLPNPYLEGCAVYPATAWEIMGAALNQDRAHSWTIACAEVVVPLAYNSPLFQHYWGVPGVAPTFIEQKTEASGVTAFALSEIRPGAALYHRCKDGSLIRLLERKLFPNARKITVVFPVCNMDFALAAHHARWLVQMGAKWDHDALVAYDGSVPAHLVKQFQAMLSGCFRHADAFHYPTPSARYPAAANAAWRNVALEMQRRNSPWFWCEADGVFLRTDALDQFQREYDGCGKPWMGYVVPGMGHLQGTAIYPPDAASRMPRAMNAAPTQAFDMEGKWDIGNDCHHAPHLLFHVWSVLNGEACPVGGGHLPVNITAEQARRWIPTTAVFAHRIKDRSLVDLLLSGAFSV